MVNKNTVMKLEDLDKNYIERLHEKTTKTCQEHPNGQQNCEECWEHKIIRFALSQVLTKMKSLSQPKPSEKLCPIHHMKYCCGNFPSKPDIPDYHLEDHAILLEMIHTLADHLGVYLQPTKDGSYKVKSNSKPDKIDKIIQITNREEEKQFWGLSESGNCYQYNFSEKKWDFILEGPIKAHNKEQTMKHVKSQIGGALKKL